MELRAREEEGRAQEKQGDPGRSSGGEGGVSHRRGLMACGRETGFSWLDSQPGSIQKGFSALVSRFDRRDKMSLKDNCPSSSPKLPREKGVGFGLPRPPAQSCSPT